MKPGGPTEKRLGGLLAEKNAPQHKRESREPQEQKVSGLLTDDTPTRRPVRRVDEPQKPKVSTMPWFTSRQLPHVPDEDVSSNRRTLEGVLRSTSNGDLPRLFADALQTGSRKSIHEYADFLRQMQETSPDRLPGFEQEVKDSLPAPTRRRADPLWRPDEEIDPKDDIQLMADNRPNPHGYGPGQKEEPPVPSTASTDKRRADRAVSHAQHKRRFGEKRHEALLNKASVSNLLKNPAEAVDAMGELLSHKLGGVRDKLNFLQPSTVDEATKMGFLKAGAGQAKFHGGDDVYKLAHPDGREVVFDKKTGQKNQGKTAWNV